MTSTLHTVRLHTASALGTSVKYATSAKQSPGPSSVLPDAAGGPALVDCNSNKIECTHLGKVK